MNCLIRVGSHTIIFRPSIASNAPNSILLLASDNSSTMLLLPSSMSQICFIAAKSTDVWRDLQISDHSRAYFLVYSCTYHPSLLPVICRLFVLLSQTFTNAPVPTQSIKTHPRVCRDIIPTLHLFLSLGSVSQSHNYLQFSSKVLYFPAYWSFFASPYRVCTMIRYLATHS